MSRLTDDIGLAACEACGECGGTCEAVDKVIEKLQHYEDLEEQGRLIELPCKVGDTVYFIHKRGDKKYIISETTSDLFMLCLCVAEGRFNDSVFLTEDAARQKIKDMEDSLSN